MEGLKWHHNPKRVIGTAKHNGDGTITCTINKVESKKLKYPRKRVITVKGWRDKDDPNFKPLVDFAEKYKRGPNSKVVVKRYEKISFHYGNLIPETSVTFYSYEPVGILRETALMYLTIIT